MANAIQFAPPSTLYLFPIKRRFIVSANSFLQTICCGRTPPPGSCACSLRHTPPIAVSPFLICNALAPAATVEGKVWRPLLVLHSYTMSPDPRPPKQAFDINVETLDSPGGLEATLRSIERICFQTDPAIAGMLSTLNNRSHILEYIFSGVSREPVASYRFARLFFVWQCWMGKHTRNCLVGSSHSSQHPRLQT